MVDAAEDKEADDEDGGAGEQEAGALRIERAAHQEQGSWLGGELGLGLIHPVPIEGKTKFGVAPQIPKCLIFTLYTFWW